MLSFRVPGNPVPKGRHRSRVVQRKGKKPLVQQYPDPNTVAFEERVAMAAKAAGATLLKGPVCVVVISVWPYRKSDPKRVTTSGLYYPKDTSPDGDNVYKAVADALQKICYRNDGQIVFHKDEDFWGPRPGTYVKVWKTTRDGRVLPGWCR